MKDSRKHAFLPVIHVFNNLLHGIISAGLLVRESLLHALARGSSRSSVSCAENVVLSVPRDVADLVCHTRIVLSTCGRRGALLLSTAGGGGSVY